MFFLPASKIGKVLVAYFSATNTTKGVAEKIAESTDGTLYQITPEQPYTSANLNYSDRNSRSTKEQNDSSARPKIDGSVENMDEYDIVFLGYPIWWGEAPKIMYTFLESYNFEGKTIVPFCTSGGSAVVGNVITGGGQILICVGGEGYYQEWGKSAVKMQQGDAINIPVGVKHWHGAGKDKWFSHLAVEVPAQNGSNEWLEPVSNEQYAEAVK